MESTLSTSVPQTLSVLSIVAVTAAVGILAGCNLDIDVDDYPYSDDAGSTADLDAGSPDADTDVAEPAIGPRPLISELMIEPSTPESTDERIGQYVEIYNAGDEAIDPTDLIIEVLETNDRIRVDTLVDSDEEADVVDGLTEIGPGEFFVFVRRDDPDFYQITDDLDDGSYYEYGRWHRTIALSTGSQTLRLLELHSPTEFEVHHEIGWREGALIEPDETVSGKNIRRDIALGLDADVDDGDEAADPANWCYHLHRFSDGPLLGSPGRPSPDSCI